MIKRVLTGLMLVSLMLSIVLSLTSCTTEKVVKVTVSPSLLEPCPVPHRVRYSNRGLRKYAVDLHKSLLQCNIDKEAIKKELGE